MKSDFIWLLPHATGEYARAAVVVVVVVGAAVVVVGLVVVDEVVCFVVVGFAVVETVVCFVVIGLAVVEAVACFPRAFSLPVLLSMATMLGSSSAIWSFWKMTVLAVHLRDDIEIDFLAVRHQAFRIIMFSHLFFFFHLYLLKCFLNGFSYNIYFIP